MGFRSAVTEVAKNIVLGAPSTLKNHRAQNHQRGKNGRDDDEMEPFDFSHEDEAQRCIELFFGRLQDSANLRKMHVPELSSGYDLN